MHPLTTDLAEQILALIKVQAYSLLGAVQDNKVVLGGSGGSDGGTGEPPAGFVGQLIQSNVTFDTAGSSRACSAGSAGSSSLVDNLDAIRLGDEICNDAIQERHLDWGTGSNQVSALDVPFATTSGSIVATNVRDAIEEAYGTGGSGVSDHGALTGLADDDHAQYLLTNGSRVLTGDWDIGDGRMIQADQIRARDSDGLALYDSGGSGIFVEDGGNVGVKRNPPYTYTLHVGGTVAVDGELRIDADGDPFRLLAGGPNVYDFKHSNAGTRRLRIFGTSPNTMDVAIDGGLRVGDNAVGAPSHTLDIDGDADISGLITLGAGIALDGSSGSNVITLQGAQAEALNIVDTNDVEYMRVDTSGLDVSFNDVSVGIGTLTPARPLEIADDDYFPLRLTDTKTVGIRGPHLEFADGNDVIGIIDVLKGGTGANAHRAGAIEYRPPSGGSGRHNFYDGDGVTAANVVMTILADDKAGIGTTSPDTLAHIYGGSAGAVTPAAGTVLTVEDDTDCFLSLLSPNTSDTGIYFGSPDSNVGAEISFDPGEDGLVISSGVGYITLQPNSGVIITTIKSGATQAAAGASASELWKTSGHATLPDNVVMHGV